MFPPLMRTHRLFAPRARPVVYGLGAGRRLLLDNIIPLCYAYYVLNTV